MNFGTFLSLQDHALLTIWLVFLHWTAYVPLAWAVIRHQAPFMQLGLGLSMALGLAVGLLANFQAFFFLVVVLKHFSLLALVSLSLMLSVGMLALLRWSVRQWPVPGSRFPQCRNRRPWSRDEPAGRAGSTDSTQPLHRPGAS